MLNGSKRTKTLFFIAALLAVLPVVGCQSGTGTGPGTDDGSATQSIPALAPQPPVPAAKRMDMEGQRGEALRSAEHLSKEEQAGSKQEAQKAKEAAPVAAESFAKSRKEARDSAAKH